MMPDGSPLCGRIKVNKVQSLGVGAEQEVPYQCPGIASVVVGDKLVCVGCAGELTNENDSSQLAEWSAQAHQWADAMAHRPELNQWIHQIADGFLRTSKTIRERG